MKKVMPVHLEQANANEFKKTIEKFELDVLAGGAILMGVCRGRLSEGLDFKDRKARVVIIVGIPYPNCKEPRIVLKKYYLDKKQQIMGKICEIED